MRKNANDDFEKRCKGVVHVRCMPVGLRQRVVYSPRTRTSWGQHLRFGCSGRTKRETAYARGEIPGE